MNRVFYNRHRLLRIPWRLSLFALLIVAAMLAMTIAAAPFQRGAAVEGEIEGLSDLPLHFASIGYLAISLSVIVASMLSLRLFDKRPASGFGLAFQPRWAKELGLGLLVGLLLIAATVAVQAAIGVVRLSPSGVPAASLLRGLPLYLLFFTGVALTEELLFRGYVLQALAEGLGDFVSTAILREDAPSPRSLRAGKITAALFLSIPFGVIHVFNQGGTWAGAASTGMAGLLLSLGYFRTRSLWLPVGMHISWNFTIAWIFSLPVSGETIPTTWFQTTVTGPVWLSGGSFGPEGSILAFLAMGIAAAYLLRSRAAEPSAKSMAWIVPPEERNPVKAEEVGRDEASG